LIIKREYGIDSEMKGLVQLTMCTNSIAPWQKVSTVTLSCNFCDALNSHHHAFSYELLLERTSKMATQETAKTLFLTAESIDYAYRLIGNSNNSPPLLLLNHVRATIDTWDPYVINNLTASGRQLITYDYAGIGHSGGSVAPSMKGFAVNLLAFLNVLLPTLHVDHIDILGFSMGGYVAQQLALDSPDVVRKLVLSGTGPSFGPGLQRPMTLYLRRTVWTDF
jgi:alpha-beta hydrolase superfamily lysophospholipase